MIFNLEKILNLAEKDILLGDKEEFIHELRITAEIRDHYQAYEKEIKQHSQLKIVSWRDVSIAGMKVGLPSCISHNIAFVYEKRPDLEKIKSNFEDAKSIGKDIGIFDYIQKNLSICKKHHQFLPDAVSVADYIIKNREEIKGLYPRQISHGKSTKLFANNPLVKSILTHHFANSLQDGQEIFEFLELRRKPVSFIFFANNVVIRGTPVKDFYGAINEKNHHDFAFEGSKTIIIENEESFVSLAEVIKDAVVIFGGGWRVAALSTFKDIFTGRVLYWGDLDAEGMEILNHVTGFIPNLRAVAMDSKIFSKFPSLVQDGIIKHPKRDVKVLSDVYRMVCQEGKRVEQEQIPIEHIMDEIELELHEEV